MLIKDIDDFLEEADEDVDYQLFEEQEREHRILLEDRGVCIEEYGIIVRAGYYEAWDDSSEEYEIDFDFYMCFDLKTKDHLYEESGSSLEVCLYNYLTANKNKKFTMEEIEGLECSFCTIS